MIRFVCECGKQLQAREESAGKRVRCPACQQLATVPDLPTTAIQQDEPIEETPRERVQRDRPSRRDEDEEELEEGRTRRRSKSASSGKALASLILGIVSLCGCSLLTGLPAIVLGILSLRDIGRATGIMTGKPMAIIGLILGSLGTLCLPIGYFFVLTTAVARVREAAVKAQSINNLKQMTLALHLYNDTYMTLPPAAIGNPNQPAAKRKALLSWRVAILPYIEEIALYNQFKLDEPWDGPNNIKLLAKMPKIYQLPGDDQTPSDHTHYQVFVGNGAAFDKTRGFRIPQDFPDGTSNTILIVTAEKAVPWTKPEDVEFDPNKPMLPLMSTRFSGVFHVSLADGSVRAVAPQLSETTFKNAIIRNDGMPLGLDW